MIRPIARFLTVVLLFTVPLAAGASVPDTPSPQPVAAPEPASVEVVPEGSIAEPPAEPDPVTQQLDTAKQAYAIELEAWPAAIAEWFAEREAACPRRSACVTPVRGPR